jgi:hypothetical protein
MGVRLIGVALASGSEPLADPARAGPDRDDVRKGPQSLDLDRRRLAGAGRRDPGHRNEPTSVQSADRLLRAEDAKQHAERSLNRAPPPLRVGAVGGNVERVVAHPPREQRDRSVDLAAPQIPHLDGGAVHLEAPGLSLARRPRMGAPPSRGLMATAGAPGDRPLRV